MKKHNIKGLAFIALAGSLMVSCDLLKDLDYTVTPDPLEMHGDSVRVKVDVVFPEKGIHKKASAEITPMLGDVALKSVTVQGEKATGNGTVIAYKAGGKMTYTDVVAYRPEFENTELKITGKVSKSGKEKESIEPIKIADATVITPLLVNKDFKVVYAEDNFQRVTEESFAAQLNYAKGKSNVTSSEMKDEDIKAYEEWLAAAQSNAKIKMKSINVVGFASPEGEEDKNNTLSTDRANAGSEAGMKIAKKAENEAAQAEGIYNASGSGEDYAGFKKELEASDKINEDEKNLIIRVLEMYPDPAKREEEMRNMKKVFTELDRNVFPKLRRAEITNVYDLTGFSDEELLANVTAKPDTLDLEELLFTATLVDDLNEKLKIYTIAENRYPEDYRAVNNAGAVLYELNKVSDAKAKFEKANGIQDNVISKNNLGAVAGVEGDRAKAWELLNQASGAGSEVNYNKGILNIQDGDYGDAISNLGDNCFNKALAQLLDGSASSVKGTLEGTDDAESAQGYYLKAIAAADQNQLSEVVSNLKSAIAKDGSYKAKAAKDREFIQYFEDATFSAIVK